MGQEASLPMDGRAVEEELEEQARAPPSTINPPVMAPGQSQSLIHPFHKEQNKGRKLIHGIMKRSVKGDKNGDDHNNFNSSNSNSNAQHDLESYEYREGARAAVAGGNVYMRDNITSEDYALQKMPSQQGEMEGPTSFNPASMRSDDSAKAEENRKPPMLEAVAAALGRVPPSASSHQHQQNTDYPAIPNTTSGNNNGSKKGLFPAGRSARGMINSMRNLSIGSALRKQKDVQDWEKQWDEDEDDESEEEEDATEEQSTIYSSAAAAVPAIKPAFPPRAGAVPTLETSFSRGMAAAPSILASDSTDLLSDSTDLLSATIAVSTSSSSAPLSVQQQQQQQVGPDWATEGLPVLQRETDKSQRKPDVQMFLPMLRVLGKGSFGKVSELMMMMLCSLKWWGNNKGMHESYSCVCFVTGCSRSKERRKRTRSALCHENSQKDPLGQTQTDRANTDRTKGSLRRQSPIYYEIALRLPNIRQVVPCLGLLPRR